jgi:thiamine biosynthesis lipoprotein
VSGRFASLLTGAGLAVLAAPAAEAQASAWRFQAEALGTSLDMVVAAPDQATALVAAQAARDEIARLDLVLSGWRADSELSALNRAETMAVSPDLYCVLAACERWRATTGGAFDARLGRISALWREAETTGAAPDLAALEAVAKRIDAEVVHLDPATRTVTRPEAVVFAPDALAKGYVIDAALAAARRAAPGLAGMMVDIGGDLSCWGAHPQGWTVGVADGRDADNEAPVVLIDAASRAVATSGRGMRDFQVAGAAYPHLLGRHANTATVVGPSAADADALSTALAVMAPAEGLALVSRLDGFEARVVDERGETLTSAGWTTVTAPQGGQLIRAAAAAGPAWPAGFQVRADYQLPRFEGARVYSPYVAIWVTDDANRLVRAVTLLGDNLDYVGENYIWWRRFGRSRPQLVQSVSRPTRKAGRYSAVWDGKDDMGRTVGQGRYTLHIEATREHGGHSYQSIPLMLGATPSQAAAAASGPTATEEESELGATTVVYGPRR